MWEHNIRKKMGETILFALLYYIMHIIKKRFSLYVNKLFYYYFENQQFEIFAFISCLLGKRQHLEKL